MMKKGFTLIELLVVILIIGVLTTVALPQYQRAIAKARTTEAMSALKAITEAQEVYFIAYDDYSPNISQLDVKVSQGKYYTYDCSNKHSCVATPLNQDCPVIEFNMSQKVNGASDVMLGKRWCRTTATSSKVAKAVCRSIGQQDVDMPIGYNMIGAIR